MWRLLEEEQASWEVPTDGSRCPWDVESLQRNENLERRGGAAGGFVESLLITFRK